MTTATERRQAPNASLRQKIDLVLAANQRLMEAALKLEAQLLSSARSGDLKNLPNQQLTQSVVEAFQHEHKQTMATIKKTMMGQDANAQPTLQAPLISSDELAALLHPNP